MLHRLQKMAVRDRAVYEVYEANMPHAPWRSHLRLGKLVQRGAGMILGALYSVSW